LTGCKPVSFLRMTVLRGVQLVCTHCVRFVRLSEQKLLFPSSISWHVFVMATASDYCEARNEIQKFNFPTSSSLSVSHFRLSSCTLRPNTKQKLFVLRQLVIAERYWCVCFYSFARISYGRFIAIRYKFKRSAYIQEPFMIGGVEYRDI
jgi:hypothetical protein